MKVLLNDLINVECFLTFFMDENINNNLLYGNDKVNKKVKYSTLVIYIDFMKDLQDLKIMPLKLSISCFLSRKFSYLLDFIFIYMLKAFIDKK